MHLVVVLDILHISTSLKKRAVELLSAEEHERYERYLHRSDAELFLFGRYLVRTLVAHATHAKPADISIMVDGIAEKPYIKGRPIEFSISHSGSFIAVAISSDPIGVDIQIHDQQDFTIFDTFFTVKEKAYAKDSSPRFYQLWTAIESLAKITGLGFNEVLQNRQTNFTPSVTGFTLSNRYYPIHTLMDSDEITLSVSTTNEVQFKKVSSEKYTAPIRIDTDGMSLTIYKESGSTDSDV